MIHKKSTFFLGLFILIIPFLGVPSFWRTILIFISGFTLIGLSVKISIPKKHIKTKTRREKVTPVFVENIPIYPANDTVEKSNVNSSPVNTNQPDIG